MAISRQVNFYNDNWGSYIRILMLIRRNNQKTVSFVTDYFDTEKIMVVESTNEIIIHFSVESMFEYTEEHDHGPLTTIEEILEYEEEYPNEAFTAAELLEMDLLIEVPEENQAAGG